MLSKNIGGVVLVGKTKTQISFVLQHVILVVSFIYFFFLIAWAPTYIEKHQVFGRGEPKNVLIATGETGKTVAEKLSKEGLVDDPEGLIFWMVKLSIDRSIKPGIYRIKPGSPWEVAKQLQTSKPFTEKVTLYPGKTYREIQEYFKNNYNEDFSNVLKKKGAFYPSVRDILPERAEDRIVFLLPDTYYVIPGESYASQAVKAASEAWYKRVGSVIGQSNLNKDHLLKIATVASLVEKETALEEEKKTIAGVIYNRLSKSMPLQVDATVVYAWGEKGIKLNRVLYKHLKIESSYNTYLVKGLPPGPICIPSIGSWMAAIFPEKHSYLFYVAKEDGSHIFSESYKEHLKAIKVNKKNKQDSK
ncbi:MAG: hypothetical protein PWP05_1060 [Thermovirga sp.]|jgi:UPF0755 protein|nr:hypothetical protein [Thermovirga sp.]MDN5368345.1 hypothetical protein [Thermovirga sp.]